MANQQLLEYVRQSLASGATKEDIRSALLNVGWPKEDVDEALDAISLGVPQMPFQAPFQVSPTQEVKKESKRVILKILIVIFILSLVFSASAAYYYLVQRPKSVLYQLPNRLADIKSFQYQINGSSEMTFISGPSKDIYGKLGKPINAVIDINGNLDLSDERKTKGSVKFLLDSKNPNAFDSKVGIESIFVPQIFYVRLSEFDLLFHEGIGRLGAEIVRSWSLISSFKGEWVKFDTKSSGRQSSIGPNAPFKGDIMTLEDDYQKIKEKYQSYSSQDLIIVKSMKSDMLDGKKVYHYQIGLDPDSAGWLIQSIKEVSMKKDYNKMSQSEKDDLGQKVKDVQKAISEIESIDLYVGKDDFYPYKFKISGKFKNSSFNDVDFFDSDSELEISISGINQTVKIEEPKKSRSFEEVMAGIMGELFGNNNQ